MLSTSPVTLKQSDLAVGTYENNFHSVRSIGDSVTTKHSDLKSNVGIYENNCHSFQSSGSSSDSGDKRNPTNGPKSFSNSPSENGVGSENIKTTQMESYSTDKPPSDTNTSKKTRPLNRTSKRKYKCIYEKRDKDNRIVAGKVHLPPSVAAGEYLYYPSPNDSNIKVNPRQNSPGKEGSKRTNAG